MIDISYNSCVKYSMDYSRIILFIMKCGIHSNIPLCCVTNFMLNLHISNKDYRADDFGYVPCPDCLIGKVFGKNKPNVLKSCDCYHQRIC